MNNIRLTKKQTNQIKNKLLSFEDDKSYPVFDTDKYFNAYEEFPFFTYSKYDRYEEYVDISKIKGDNWAFEDKKSRGRYPSLYKLQSITDYYGGILLFGNKDLPAVPLCKINDTYYLEEGNHRLYFLKYLTSIGLAKNPKIKAIVQDYKYNEFLQNSKLLIRNNTYYILYDNYNLEPIEEDTYKRLQELISI